MTTQTNECSYQSYAQEHGYKVGKFGFLGKFYYWYKESDPENVSSEVIYSNVDSCYMACCEFIARGER